MADKQVCDCHVYTRASRRTVREIGIKFYIPEFNQGRSKSTYKAIINSLPPRYSMRGGGKVTWNCKSRAEPKRFLRAVFRIASYLRALMNRWKRNARDKKERRESRSQSVIREPSLSVSNISNSRYRSRIAYRILFIESCTIGDNRSMRSVSAASCFRYRYRHLRNRPTSHIICHICRIVYIIVYCLQIRVAGLSEAERA